MLAIRRETVIGIEELVEKADGGLHALRSLQRDGAAGMIQGSEHREGARVGEEDLALPWGVGHTRKDMLGKS